ncbi:MAG: hypothetical protein ACD_22C00244G0001 [uncultured bacterium]|nr:MAG: hypothetical protein ACD_22C00244G0001 [uncultured bacterium]
MPKNKRPVNTATNTIFEIENDLSHKTIRATTNGSVYAVR